MASARACLAGAALLTMLSRSAPPVATPNEQIVLVIVCLIASKGAAAVTGSGFIVLAATIGAVGHVPVASIALLLGIDRFMSEARALTNFIGTAVATVVVAKWEGELDQERFALSLDNPEAPKLSS